ncbi:hypothetical protein FJ365_03380 [Candidatus Dependentiae bacterium]|nr:hypothetical protein [Candidatus Dependentiae bacterium]
MAKLILFSMLCLSTIQIIDAAHRRRLEERFPGEEHQQINITLMQDEDVSMLDADAIVRGCNTLIPDHFMFIEKSNIITSLLVNGTNSIELARRLRIAIENYKKAIADDLALSDRWQSFRTTFADYAYSTNFELALLMRILNEKPYSETYHKLIAVYQTKAETLKTT